MDGNLIFYIVFAALAVFLIALVFLKSKMRKRYFLPVFFIDTCIMTAIALYTKDKMLLFLSVLSLFWAVFLIIRTITKTIDF